MKKQTGIRNVLFLIGIMLTNVAVMADLAIYVIVNNLYEAFPGNMNVVNFIISGTALMVMISSLLASGLMKKMGKKNLLVVMGIIFSAATVGGALLENVWYIAVMRGIAGFTMGCINVAAVAILTDYYEDDEAKRAKMIGLYNTLMPITGSVLSALAGVLALNGWKNIFHVYWLGVLMVVLVILFVPADSKAVAVEETKDKSKHHMGASFWYMSGTFFLTVLAIMMMQMFYSVYITENQLGDAAFIGIVNTVIGYGSVLANFLFGFIYEKTGRKIVYLAYALGIIGGALLFFFPGKIVVFVGYFMALACYGFCFSTAYVYTPTLCPKSSMEFGIGIATAVYSVGTFLATYAVTLLQSILKIETFTNLLPIMIGILAVLLVLEWIIPAKLKTPIEE